MTEGYGWREEGREVWREGGMEGGREGGRVGGREPWREGCRAARKDVGGVRKEHVKAVSYEGRFRKQWSM